MRSKYGHSHSPEPLNGGKAEPDPAVARAPITARRSRTPAVSRNWVNHSTAPVRARVLPAQRSVGAQQAGCGVREAVRGLPWDMRKPRMRQLAPITSTAPPSAPSPACRLDGSWRLQLRSSSHRHRLHRHLPRLRRPPGECRCTRVARDPASDATLDPQGRTTSRSSVCPSSTLLHWTA